MANYDIGNLIKRLRKQRGLTQEELAYPLIDRATLSKIEGGKVTPSKRTTEALLQRLGFNPVNATDFFLDEEMSRIHKIMEEIRVLNSHRGPSASESSLANAAKVDELIAQLKSNENFMQSKLNVQFVMMHKCKNAYINRHEGPEEVMPMMLEALKITIPEYSQRHIKGYYLTSQETGILHDISIMAQVSGDDETAIEICEALRKNVKENILDMAEMGIWYTTITNSLARCLSLAGRYQEALDVCDEGIAVGRQTKVLISLPNIVAVKARCLFELGDKEEAEKLYRQAYHTCALAGLFATMEAIRESAEARLGVKM